MKTIKSILILGVFLVLAMPVAFGFEFDNKVTSFDPETNTIIIKDSFLGIPTTTVGTIQRLDYDEYCLGSDCCVPFHVDSNENSKSLQESTFYNRAKNIEKRGIESSYYIMDRFAFEEVPTYKEECKDVINPNTSKTIKSCIQIKDGTRKVYGVWKEFDFRVMPKGGQDFKVCIDNIRPGQTVELVPNFFGVDLFEFAPLTGLKLYEYYRTGDDDAGTIGGGGGNESYGQTWTLGAVGINETTIIRGFGIYASSVNKGGDMVYVVVREVNSSNDPLGDVISSKVFNSSAEVGSLAWYNFTFDVNGTANVSGKFAITFNAMVNTGANDLNWRRDASSPAYTGGSALARGAGNIWVQQANDHLFEIYGLPFSAPAFTVTLDAPDDNYNTRKTSVDFTCSGDGGGVDDLLNITLEIWYNNDSTGYYANTVDITGITNSSSWNVTSIPEATYDWNCWVESDLPNGTYASANRTFSIDQTGPTVNILAPAVSKVYNEFNLTLNYSYSETASNCWYKYNSGSVIALPNCHNSSFVGRVDSDGAAQWNNISVFVNDSVGNIGATSLDLGIFNITSRTFSEDILEDTIDNIELNIDYDFSYHSLGATLINTPIVNLIYNNTLFNMSRISTACSYDAFAVEYSNCNNMSFGYELTTPINGSSASNYTIDFNITFPSFTSSGLTFIETNWTDGTYYQYVNPFVIYECPENAVNTTLNITGFYAEDRAINNVTLDFVFTYWKSSRELNRTINGTLSSDPDHSFCISPDYAQLYMDGFIKFYEISDDLVDRTYYLRNSSITNTSKNINLMELNNSLDTLFTFTLKDAFYAPAQGWYLEALRYYPDINSYITSEIGETNVLGETLLSLYKEEAFYRFFIYEYDVLKKTIDGFKPTCVAGSICEYTFSAVGDPENPFATTPDGVTYEVSYNNDTKTISFTFTDTKGTTRTGQLDVIKVGSIENSLVCGDTATSTAATIICDLSSEGTGTYNYKGYIDNNITFSKTVTEATDFRAFGTEGMFWAALLVIFVAMFGIAFAPPIIALILPVGMLAVLSVFGIIALPVAVVVELFVLIIFAIVKMRS